MAPPDALLDLVIAEGQGRLRNEIPNVTTTLPNSRVSLIPGARSHTQPAALTGLWDPLLSAVRDLATTGQDTIVDLGRLGHTGSAAPFVYGADLTLVVLRTDLVSLSGAQSWVGGLRREFEQFGAPTSLGLVVVGPGQPYTAREVSDVLQVPVVTTIAWDPKAAPAFSHGEQVRKLDGSSLVRSLRSAHSEIQAVIVANHADLTDVAEGTP